MQPDSSIQYTINTSTALQVFNHLKNCDDKFISGLSAKVDLKKYAEKIHNNAVTFEAWKDDELVGLVAAYINNIQTKTAFITNVSTIKNLGEKGIGSALIKMCIDYATANNYLAILLEVNTQNFAAIRLYEKYNFITTEEKSETLQMKLNL